MFKSRSPTAARLSIVGDGAFQMTGMELSTLIRHKFPAIIIVLDNNGYGTERFLHPSCNFNDIQPWQYHKLPEVLGGGKGYEIHTEGEFDAALKRAWADTSGPSLLQVHIGPDDISTALRRLAERLSKRVYALSLRRRTILQLTGIPANNMQMLAGSGTVTRSTS